MLNRAEIDQTEGAPLPDLSEQVKGEGGEYRERLMDFLTAQGIELEFKGERGSMRQLCYRK